MQNQFNFDTQIKPLKSNKYTSDDNLTSLFGFSGANRQISWITVRILYSWDGDVNVYSTEEQFYTNTQRN